VVAVQAGGGGAVGVGGVVIDERGTIGVDA
jgi:hypothetical protein